MSLIFSITFTLNIILYEFQVYSIEVRQSHTLQHVPPGISYPPGTIHSYYNIIDYIPYVVLYIPMTVLLPPICTSQPSHCFHKSFPPLCQSSLSTVFL